MANWILQQEGLPFFPQVDAVLHPALLSTKTSTANTGCRNTDAIIRARNG